MPSLPLRIYSYNLLSSSLASPGYFTACTPANLDQGKRFEKILTKLSAETSKNSIICLQELSRKWEGQLHVFFESKNYQLVTGLYGHSFNGYMGVALAYPLDVYQADDVEVVRLSDTDLCESWPVPPNTYKRSSSGQLSKLLKPMIGLAKFPMTLFKKITGSLASSPPSANPEIYGAAKKRSNILISAKLRAKNTPKTSTTTPTSDPSFLVSTYHMPCAFMTPQLMTLHSSLAIRYTKKRAEALSDVPFVCAGDWNILPSSPLYGMLTTGILDPEDKVHYPPPCSNFAFSPDIGDGCMSAYQEALGSEPDFTNYAKIKNDDPFIGTLDYIFLSKGCGWKVKSVDSIPHRDDVKGPFPNDEEPSDHVAIAADLDLDLM